MFTPLIEYFKSTKPENISRIDLEEIALIQALLDSWSNSSTNAEKLAFVPGLVKNWLNLDPPVDEEDKPSPIAKGVFDQNVIICTDKYLIDASKTRCDGLHVTTASRGIRSYSITENKISQIE
ncbi:MAG: hypothetical protein VCC01_06730 [Candidatus Hydrogenedentota bacterium]